MTTPLPVDLNARAAAIAAGARPHFVSAALPYVNGAPHVGHALEIVQADVLARFARLRGQELRFVSGSDENSLKNVRAAEAAGVETARHVAANAERFVLLNRLLHASLDGFVRTSVDREHARTASWLFERCRERGDIYKRAYRGLYCPGCEQFYKESELVEGLCPEHARAPEVVEEENYFFRLSRYGSELTELITSGALQIAPRERRNEVLQFIADGLSDFSVSRCRARCQGWGIAVPGDDSQVIFVWFDALGGYLSASGGANELEPAGFWQCAASRTHVIGKGVVRFHAVYWPALLLSAGLLPPTRICVHGYLTAEGKKIGKSLGNAVDPFALLARFGADALRYYLLRHVSTTLDGDFSSERIQTAYDSELANQLGNLVQRAGGLLARFSGGVVPAPDAHGLLEIDTELIQIASACLPEVERAIDAFDLRRALDAVIGLVVATNRYVDHTEPWALARRHQHARLGTVLYAVAQAISLIGLGLSAFLPGTAAAIAQRVASADGAGTAKARGGAEITCPATSSGVTEWAAAGWGRLAPGTPFLQGPALFPRLPELSVAGAR